MSRVGIRREERVGLGLVLVLVVLVGLGFEFAAELFPAEVFEVFELLTVAEEKMSLTWSSKLPK